MKYLLLIASGRSRQYRPPDGIGKFMLQSLLSLVVRVGPELADYPRC